MRITIIANKISWDFESSLPKLTEWFKICSSDRLSVTFDVVRTAFDDIPITPFSGKHAVDVDWYRKNITPLGTGQITVLLLNPDQYVNNDSIWGFMTWRDDGKPVRCEVMSDDEPNFPEAPLVVHRIFHEAAHALFSLTGQTDRVHELLFQDPPKRKELLDLIDYQKLQTKLLTINQTNMSNQSKVVKSKNSNTVWICQPVPDMDYLNKKANLEGFQIPANIPNSDSL